MGPIAVCKEFLPLLKQSEASRIINISSSCAETRLPMASIYGASKVNRSFRDDEKNTKYLQAGLEAFNDSLRIEASPVHLILIEPGELFSLTPMGSKQTSHQLLIPEVKFLVSSPQPFKCYKINVEQRLAPMWVLVLFKIEKLPKINPDKSLQSIVRYLPVILPMNVE